MIESLTQEQRDQFPHYVEKYKAIGLNTDRIDYDLAVQTMKDFLDDDAKGCKFVFAESPAKIPKTAENITYGNMESYWVAFYKFFYDNFGICEEIEKMVPVIENCSWVFHEAGTIYIVDRPSIIKFDDQNRTHSESGPAIRYEDGFEVYVWHGTRVPKEWIMNPENLTSEEFLNHPNAEMRRSACEIVGWAKVLERLDAKVVDEDSDPEIGTLLEVDIPEIGTERFLKVMCGTKREFAMPVPPNMSSAIEAQAWMLGFDSVDEFMPPEIRT